MAAVVDLSHVPAPGQEDASQIPEAEANAAYAEQVRHDVAYRPSGVVWCLGETKTVPPAVTCRIQGLSNRARDEWTPECLQSVQGVADGKHYSQASAQLHGSVPIQIGTPTVEKPAEVVEP